MKNSSLLKWASNNKKTSKDEKSGGDSNGKKWLHNPDTLKNGHVAYIVKFLGSTEVDQPKGIEVVKQGVQKLKFNQQLKKSEGGQNAGKTPKVELTISVEGVAIQEPKTKKVLHQYPLHKISYCADDRAEKRFFSFISKEGESEKHTCFVFVSDKLAEEITLTIGQAFELAYQKFLDNTTNGGGAAKGGSQKDQKMSLQKKVEILENENSVLAARLTDLAKIKQVQEYMDANNITDLCHVDPPAAAATSESEETKSDQEEASGGEVSTSSGGVGQESEAKEDKKDTLINLEENGDLDGFTLDDLNDLNDFNPRAGSANSNAATAGNAAAAGTSDDDDEFNPRAEAPPAASSLYPALPPREPVPSSAVAAPALPPREAPPAKAVNSEFNADSFFGSNNNNKVAAGNNNISKNPFANNTFSGVATAPAPATTTTSSTDPFGMSLFESAGGIGGGGSNAFTKFPGNSIASGFADGGWGSAAGGGGNKQQVLTPVPAAINAMSLDDLDPLKK